jgi:hypothetical protein
MKTMKKEFPAGGSEAIADSSRKMHSSLIDYRCIVQVIENGITNRKFYILASPDQIPGYKESGKGKRLECIQQFAETNHWQVTIHNQNGWLIFTAEEIPLARSIESYFGQLA